MNDMSISPTPSRTVRCSSAHCSNHGAWPQVGSATAVSPGPANQSAPSQPDTSRSSPPLPTSRSCTGESSRSRAVRSCLPGVWAAYTVPRISVVRSRRYAGSSWSARKRATSHAVTSTSGSPAMIQCASTRPRPPAERTPTEFMPAATK